MTNAYEFARALRTRDRFHPEQHAAEVMLTFFPEDARALALDLSQVTSMFYGLMLQIAGERFGAEVMDSLSRALFYRLGRAKARATRDQKGEQFFFYEDARDMVTILISAIYNASPEYEFCIERFDAERCEVRLSGVDRYYRAAQSLGIAERLTWPTLHPFFEGVSDELALACEVRSELLSMADGARLDTRYVFERRASVRAGGDQVPGRAA